MNRYMDMAVNLARMSAGQTSVNPPVGAVVVKNGRFIGYGAHLKAGELHAERAALNSCIESAAGADIYVTLEPCSHHGKTPPCTDAVIEAGIKRVYYAARDVNDKVDGLKVLNDQGIETIYLKHPDIEELYRPFNTGILNQRPFITLKGAMSLDGKIAHQNGDSHWVSNEYSRLDVHHLRQQHDGILIGGNTLLNDNPSLTTRLSDNDSHPVPVILLGSQTLKADMNIFKHPHKPIIFTSNKENAAFEDRAELCFGSYDLSEILYILYERNIASLLVEGGSSIHTQFLNENLFDDLIIYIAPKIFGYSEYQLHQGDPDGQLNLILHHVEKLESDIKLTYRRTQACLQD
ncbi:bifunctional diaminohydroxyphosphoribosylaminopyrimidine deaminase/5-amino-6-(5-phosphoribosylamino)uracil reductase RibD [Jeotgalicoccus halotolerans]|uniref:bifunctional diaminohydroxyphosphoribosylaminopyrimidine deaminase/5-amino-6-(5-phosphoribosylamino)uracil reductase RibD n=1 Tax=Jeotgalicoccus halotolerans TaxID=157227 RepID=UPI0035125C59